MLELIDQRSDQKRTNYSIESYLQLSFGLVQLLFVDLELLIEDFEISKLVVFLLVESPKSEEQEAF